MMPSFMRKRQVGNNKKDSLPITTTTTATSNSNNNNKNEDNNLKEKQLNDKKKKKKHKYHHTKQNRLFSYCFCHYCQNLCCCCRYCMKCCKCCFHWFCNKTSAIIILCWICLSLNYSIHESLLGLGSSKRDYYCGDRSNKAVVQSCKKCAPNGGGGYMNGTDVNNGVPTWCAGDCRWCAKPQKSSQIDNDDNDNDNIDNSDNGGVCVPASEYFYTCGILYPKQPPSTYGKTSMTISVILPCSNEHEFFERTVLSIYEMTPTDILMDIIIVDDGSYPPLEPLFRADASRYKIKFVRLDQQSSRGLIYAKQIGAEFARGDILVFFDCHVKPAKDYWRAFVDSIESNYRRVVVPTITDLDVNTWTEMERPTNVKEEGMSKCYLTFDGDFKWTMDNTNYVPIMSGGLLAISRRWFFELGGYDYTEMKGWGGENLDQSLRIWRCGGEIVSSSSSFVAHMWRDTIQQQPITRAKYTINNIDMMKNRARAMKAHTGPWYVKKTLTFPSFLRLYQRLLTDAKKNNNNNNNNNNKEIGIEKKEMMDIVDKEKALAPMSVSSIINATSHLSCQSFEWYLRRFNYIYRDAGVLPNKVFQIEAIPKHTHINKNKNKTKNKCLQLKSKHRQWDHGAVDNPNDELIVSDCLIPPEDPSKEKRYKSTQWWHLSNRKMDGSCCNTFRVWNTDQCLGLNTMTMSTSICTLNSDMEAQVTLDGLLQLGSSSKKNRKKKKKCIILTDALELSLVSCNNDDDDDIDIKTKTNFTWKISNAFEPIEYTLLSDELKQHWNAVT